MSNDWLSPFRLRQRYVDRVVHGHFGGRQTDLLGGGWWKSSRAIEGPRVRARVAQTIGQRKTR